MPPSGCAAPISPRTRAVPELPEVETARRMVEQHLAGLTVESVDVRLPKLLRDSSISDPHVLIGAQVLGARRRAKVLSIGFSNGLSLMLHFKLAGQWAILFPDGSRLVAGHPVPAPDAAYPHKSTHADIRFRDGTVVHYSDIRQFGWWRILPSEDVQAAFDAFGFGPEGVEAPLDIEALRAAQILAEDRPQVNVVAVAATEEEIGLVGATTLSWHVKPQVAIAIDVTHATDYPGANKRGDNEISVGGGPVLGRGSSVNPRVFQGLRDAGRKLAITTPVQASGLRTGTDADSIIRSGANIATGVISIPNRYMHSPSEIVSLTDLESAAQVIAEFVRTISPESDFRP